MTKIKKTRCSVDGCKTAIAKIVGHCAYCDSNYCLAHRLPEQHTCEQQEKCNITAKDLLTNKLINEAVKSKKL